MLAYCARVRASRIEEADSAASAGFYKKKLDEGFSATTVVYLHNVLHKALDTAVKWELVAKNVCDLVTPPRQKPFEVQALTLEQVQKLLAVSDGHHMEAFFKLALAIGMRRGELMGLKWQDIDMEHATLHVQRALTRMPTTMGGGYQEAEPKTEKSRRTIVLPDFALDALRKHCERQEEIKRKTGEFWQEHDYVFCTPLGTHIHPGHDILEEFKKLLKRAGLPDIRFHDLRHSASTMLLGMGVHPKIVQERLGHHDIGTTMDVLCRHLPGDRTLALPSMKPGKARSGIAAPLDAPASACKFQRVIS